MDRELVDWFQPYDEGDMPELHLVGLTAEEVVRCFDVIAACGPRWSDRKFHIDAKGVDVTVPERPDVARLVVDGRASHACKVRRADPARAGRRLGA